MNYPITPMNCRQLLRYLEDGGTLRSRWVYGKQVNILTLPNGERIYVQRSNVKALLKSGVIRSILFSGDNYEYYLAKVEQ